MTQTVGSISTPLNSRMMVCRFCRQKAILRSIPASLYSDHLERCHPDVYEKWQAETRTVS